MQSPLRFTSLALLLGIAAASPAMANLVPLNVSFGGSGIPNSYVEVDTYQDSNFAITLGLTAHQRYSGPMLANDGVDTFFAQPGGDTAHGQPGYATWNFGFYAGFAPTSGSAASQYAAGNSVALFYDLNPASTPPGGSGATVGGPIPVGAFVNGAFQNSWNLGMNFLSGGGFNPCAPGEYDFRLVAYQGYNEVASSAIRVVVAAAPPSVPDGGSTLLLVGLALSAVVAVNRRQRV